MSAAPTDVQHNNKHDFFDRDLAASIMSNIYDHWLEENSMIQRLNPGPVRDNHIKIKNYLANLSCGIATNTIPCRRLLTRPFTIKVNQNNRIEITFTDTNTEESLEIG